MLEGKPWEMAMQQRIGKQMEILLITEQWLSLENKSLGSKVKQMKQNWTDMRKIALSRTSWDSSKLQELQ